MAVLNIVLFTFLSAQGADAVVNFRGSQDGSMLVSLQKDSAKSVDVEWGSLGLGVGIGAVLVGAIAGLVLKATSNPESKTVEESPRSEFDEPYVPEPPQLSEEELAEADAKADLKASKYQKLVQLLLQKAAQETGPKISKAVAIESALESRLFSLPGKVKKFFMQEMLGTAAQLLAQEACPEAMLLFDLDKAAGANFPPTPVLIAGALSPAILGFMTAHHALQLVTVGLPVFILCIVAISVDSQAPCPGVPSLFAWIWTQTFLAACLVVGHAALLLKIFLGKQRLAAKAQELQDKKAAAEEESARDDAVGGMIILQEALLVEADIRNSVWTNIVGVATCVWLVTGIWNVFLSARYTFVPGVVAFHPGAANIAPEYYCGAWMTIIVLNISLLLTMLYLVANVLNVGQWFCNLMVENQGFQQAMIQQGRSLDGSMPVPVMELLMKAFLLRGSSDTVNARLGVVKGRKALLEQDLAALEAKTAALDKDIEGITGEEVALKAEAKDKGVKSEGCLADMGVGSMEAVDNDMLKDLAVEEAELQAKALQEATDKGIEELMGMMNEAAEAMEKKAKEAKRRARQTMADAEALTNQAMDAANDPEVRKKMMEEANKALEETKAKAAETAEQAKQAAGEASKDFA